MNRRERRSRARETRLAQLTSEERDVLLQAEPKGVDSLPAFEIAYNGPGQSPSESFTVVQNDEYADASALASSIGGTSVVLIRVEDGEEMLSSLIERSKVLKAQYEAKKASLMDLERRVEEERERQRGPGSAGVPPPRESTEGEPQAQAPHGQSASSVSTPTRPPYPESAPSNAGAVTASDTQPLLRGQAHGVGTASAAPSIRRPQQTPPSHPSLPFSPPAPRERDLNKVEVEPTPPPTPVEVEGGGGWTTSPPPDFNRRELSTPMPPPVYPEALLRSPSSFHAPPYLMTGEEQTPQRRSLIAPPARPPYQQEEEQEGGELRQWQQGGTGRSPHPPAVSSPFPPRERGGEVPTDPLPPHVPPPPSRPPRSVNLSSSPPSFHQRSQSSEAFVPPPYDLPPHAEQPVRGEARTGVFLPFSSRRSAGAPTDYDGGLSALRGDHHLGALPQSRSRRGRHNMMMPHTQSSSSTARSPPTSSPPSRLPTQNPQHQQQQPRLTPILPQHSASRWMEQLQGGYTAEAGRTTPHSYPFGTTTGEGRGGTTTGEGRGAGSERGGVGESDRRHYARSDSDRMHTHQHQPPLSDHPHTHTYPYTPMQTVGVLPFEQGGEGLSVPAPETVGLLQSQQTGVAMGVHPVSVPPPAVSPYFTPPEGNPAAVCVIPPYVEAPPPGPPRSAGELYGFSPSVQQRGGGALPMVVPPSSFLQGQGGNVEEAHGIQAALPFLSSPHPPMGHPHGGEPGADTLKPSQRSPPRHVRSPLLLSEGISTGGADEGLSSRQGRSWGGAQDVGGSGE
uniref:Uncharacterized protein n=1 Tax=Chromera velia CCMP2878 TaxID=1169474 RepID=A0A0G4IE77_9ALVE|eukprot:Cvel_2396.t1-p1 / transcript=Cvel_2396.t1 / gene=Cvel_2396 / organism=Chromera_velia_CCMP2878 / gene_product=hypothetical protein / transcript_product=hypothetical protein / location=Cvel_scaffold93:81020-83820(+) / protein_length=789 / sequence_SO=supercontig / SO=protein_coding / is_pseudo=false